MKSGQTIPPGDSIPSEMCRISLLNKKIIKIKKKINWKIFTEKTHQQEF